MRNVAYLLAGIVFGLVLIKGEIISWFRIQEMFRFQSFHMYGIIGTAILVGLVTTQLMKLTKATSLDGEEIELQPKEFSKGLVIGGVMFGFGWALTGACPGPIYTQIGAGYLPVIITLVSAIAGTWLYGAMRQRLPH
jgi:uncharacterized membrane protein YedE/YeeE